MKRIFYAIYVICLVFLIALSCAGPKPRVGEEKIVDSSGKKPDWINQPSVEKENELFFTGQMSNAKNRAFGMKQAHADGISQVLNSMRNRARTEAAQAAQGSNLSEGDVGIFSEFAVGWISDNITFAGITAPESYWEKVEKNTGYGVEYYYNCYVRLRISRENYTKTLMNAFKAAAQKAQQENNKEAEKTMQRVLDTLRQGTP